MSECLTCVLNRSPDGLSHKLSGSWAPFVNLLKTPEESVTNPKLQILQRFPLAVLPPRPISMRKVRYLQMLVQLCTVTTTLPLLRTLEPLTSCSTTSWLPPSARTMWAEPAFWAEGVDWVHFFRVRVSQVQVEYECESSSTIWYLEYKSGASSMSLVWVEYESGTSWVGLWSSSTRLVWVQSTILKDENERMLVALKSNLKMLCQIYSSGDSSDAASWIQ